MGHLEAQVADALAFAAHPALRVKRTGHQRHLEGERASGPARQPATGDLLDFTRVAAHDGAVLARIGQPQRKALGEEIVELVVERGGPGGGNDKVDAVRSSLPRQRDEALKRPIGVFPRVVAEGVNQLGDIINQQHDGRLDLGRRTVVVLDQRADAHPAKELLAGVNQLVQLGKELLHPLFVAALVGADDRADVGQIAQHL